MKSKPLSVDQSSSHTTLVLGPGSTTYKEDALVLLLKGQQLFIFAVNGYPLHAREPQ